MSAAPGGINLAAAAAAAAAHLAAQGARVGTQPPLAPPASSAVLSGAVEQKHLLPKKEVGCIVGPGGEKIKRMRTESGCRIQIGNDCVPGVEPPSQMITFQGTEQQIAAAVALVQEARKENMMTPGGPSASGAAAAAGKMEMVHKFPTDMIPKLIGKAGCNISAIRMRSGAHVKVEASAPGQVEQAVTFTGTAEQVSAAIGLVHETLAAATAQPGASSSVPLGGHQMTLQCPKKRIGFLVGSKGKTIQEIRTMSGAKIDIANDEPYEGAEHQVITISGPEASVQSAVFLITEVLQKADVSDAAAAAAESAPAVAPPAFQTSVPCPRARVGLLVGAKGKTIAEIRNAFPQCKIEISNDLAYEGAEHQLIKISGDEAGTAAAAAHITELVNAPEGQTHTVAAALPAGPNLQRVHCPTERVNKLIGPKGSNIQHIRSTYGVKVDIANEAEFPGAEHQIITVSGDETNVSAAVGIITGIISGTADLQSAGSTQTTVHCPKAKVGKLVGPQGATIKSIRSTYGVKVDIANEPEYPGAEHQIVTISGDLGNVATAAHHVQQIINGTEPTAIPAAYSAPLDPFAPPPDPFAPPASFSYPPPIYQDPYAAAYGAAPPAPFYQPPGASFLNPPAPLYQNLSYMPPTAPPPLTFPPAARGSLGALPLPISSLPHPVSADSGAFAAAPLGDPFASLGKRSAEDIATDYFASKAPRL